MEASKLRLYLEEAKKLLEEQSNYQTLSAKRALEDMIARAEDTLAGKALPFTENRQFICLSQEENYEFVAMRYTMAPTYLEDGTVYDHYGLLPAMEWFKSRDMRRGSEEEWRSRIQEVIRRSGKSLEEWKVGTDIGCYGAEGREKLLQAREKLENALEKGDARDEISRIAVTCINALAAFRDSRILRSDIFPEDTLLSLIHI